MQIVYIPSESMSVQGKKDEIYKRYGKDWNIREQGGGNGNWLLTRKSACRWKKLSYFCT